METEICHNCKKEIPQNNYLMHVAHCARNMVVCPICGEAVPKGHLQDHQVQQHSMVECKDCRFKVQSGAMKNHVTNVCFRRIAPCAYCELELPRCDLPEHENYCGARTERCDECGELVMLKYQKIHLESNHGFLKLDDEPGPLASWESPRMDMTSIAASLPTERNVNSVPSASKTDYKTPISDSGREFRDNLRSYVLPYDTTEDLRAKVKLARHDLNEIKQSFMMSEEKKDNKFRNERLDNLNLIATNKTTEKFTTNLVPYEKNQSYKVNTMPLEDNPKNYYNYLGEKESPSGNQRNLFTAKEKNVKKNSVNDLKKFEDEPTPSTPKRHLGAVPRSTRRRAPSPPVVIPSNSPADEVILPCEFCESMIPASQLVQHETGCRSDLTQFRDKDVSASVSPEVQLPCEFCFSLYPASKLLSHQALCDV